MRKPLFTKKPSFLVALTLIFSVLFTAIVYACSGLDPMRMSFHPASMNGGTVERGPCSEHKQDICKSVRYRMLSIHASSPPAEIPLYSSTFPQVSIEVPVRSEASLATLPLETAFHPVFKLSLTYSYLVLRI